jgi:hypothetical protein
MRRTLPRRACRTIASLPPSEFALTQRWFRFCGVLLAFFGQGATALGLPASLVTWTAGAVSVCGCSEADRTSGRCCCAQAGLPSPCCQFGKAKSPAAPAVAPTSKATGGSCCSTKKTSCCETSHDDTPVDQSTPETPDESPRSADDEKSRAKSTGPLTAVGGMAMARCLGFFDPDVSPLLTAAISPSPPMCVEFVSEYHFTLPTLLERAEATVWPPDPPPPR